MEGEVGDGLPCAWDASRLYGAACGHDSIFRRVRWQPTLAGKLPLPAARYRAYSSQLGVVSRLPLAEGFVMLRFLAASSLVVLLATAPLFAADPESTVQSATNVLHDVMNTPGKAIPGTLLQNAQAVVIIPRTIKLGFIVGGQRGHGVVMTRSADGGWSAPQFVILTGGSIGWQAGAQSSDFILLFRTPESVESMLNGKFTIGADASAAAGPVGRRVNASTDIELHSEILSYARSKGLFAGVSLDGSVLQVDPSANAAFYAGRELAPDSAAQLVDLLGQYSGQQVVAQAAAAQRQPVPQNDLPQPQPQPNGTIDLNPPAPAAEAISKTEAARRALVKTAPQMYAALNDQWRTYLALPADVFDPREAAQPEALKESLTRFDNVARDERYRALATQREFQETHRLLKAYAAEQSKGAQDQPRLALPPPPAEENSSRRVKRASATIPLRAPAIPERSRNSNPR
jgi:lipid-binding SYLF domain-containing protein